MNRSAALIAYVLFRAPRGQCPLLLQQRTKAGMVGLSALCGGLNRSTQHFILEGKDGVYSDGSEISSWFHCGRADGAVESLGERGIAESAWASV